jgi:hypothetical protein
LSASIVVDNVVIAIEKDIPLRIQIVSTYAGRADTSCERDSGMIVTHPTFVPGHQIPFCPVASRLPVVNGWAEAI